VEALGEEVVEAFVKTEVGFLDVMHVEAFGEGEVGVQPLLHWYLASRGRQ